MNFKQGLIKLLLFIGFAMIFTPMYYKAPLDYSCDSQSEDVDGALIHDNHKQSLQGRRISDALFFTKLKGTAEIGANNGKQFLHESHAIIISKSSNKVTIDQINLMTLSELMELKGIGQKTALNILAYIDKYGPFINKEEMLQVSGIGERKLNDIFDDTR